MRLIKILSLLILPTLLLSSCFWDKGGDEKKWPENPPIATDANGVPTQQAREFLDKQIAEQQRIQTLSELNKENIWTQIETFWEKKVLKDRRLLINHLKSQKINTSKALLSELEKMGKFLKDQGVELSESDFNVIVTAYDIESTDWDVCGNFFATQKDLDTKSEFYPMLDKLCERVKLPAVD